MPLASQRESNRINGLSGGHLSKVCGLALRSRSRSMRGRRMSMDESGGDGRRLAKKDYFNVRSIKSYLFPYWA